MVERVEMETSAHSVAVAVGSKGVPSATDFVHAAVVPDGQTGSMLTTICQSTAFKQLSVERYQESGYTYSRSANPTVAVFEKKVGMLENSKFPAVVFGTGMAATNCLFCSFVRTGDHVLITRCSYGGTNRAARVLYAKQFGVEVEFIDMTDVEEIRRRIKPGKTRMIISETPCNPTLQLADLEAISALAKECSKSADTSAADEAMEAGAGPSWSRLEGRIIHVADCTLAPPVMMRGLDFGADVVLISLTKFYDGLNTHLGGALVTNDDLLYDHMRFKQNVMGSIMTPNTAFAMLQSVKTLHLRFKQQSENAMLIAKFLEEHPKVESVFYPGLESHPQHALALKQHTGYHGSMVSLEIRGGSEAGIRVMNACSKPWTLAENLGASESIMTCPAVFTHSNMPREARQAVGITDGLIRLSVGIEDPQDLIRSLGDALNAA